MLIIPGSRRKPCRSDALGILLGSRNANRWEDAYAEAADWDALPLLAGWRDHPACRPEHHAAITAALVANTARNQLFLHELGRLLDGFATAGMPVRLLKGAASIQDCYAELGERRLGDLDLLVPKDRLAEAAALLTERGYRPLVPGLERSALADPHLLTTSHVADHHHWPPLVGPDGVVVELHWTLGDGFGGAVDDLWRDSTALPVGHALAWDYRFVQALLSLAAKSDPRAVADAVALLARAPEGGMATLPRHLAASPRLQAGLARLAAWNAMTARRLSGLSTAPVAAGRWRHRLRLLRSSAHVSLFLRLGWQAWRYPRDLAARPLPQVAARLANPARWRRRVGAEDVVAYVGFWTRQRWLGRPSYCLMRSAVLFAGLTAIGERAALTFGLDPHHDHPEGHAWVERDGEPYLEDVALLQRMVVTYRYEAG